MELHYAPLACSLAARIVCREAELDVVMKRVDLASHRVEGGGTIERVNAIGKVPALVLDDGRVLTESAAVLLFLGDRAPARRLVPPEGSLDRYDVVRWLSFVATEVHKRVLSTVFAIEPPPDAVKAHARSAVAQPLAVLESHLGEHAHLAGDTFTVADAYLVWALAIMPFGEMPLDAYPAVSAYVARQLERPAVRAVFTEERRLFRTPFPDA